MRFQFLGLLDGYRFAVSGILGISVGSGHVFSLYHECAAYQGTDDYQPFARLTCHTSQPRGGCRHSHSYKKPDDLTFAVSIKRESFPVTGRSLHIRQSLRSVHTNIYPKGRHNVVREPDPSTKGTIDLRST